MWSEAQRHSGCKHHAVQLQFVFPGQWCPADNDPTTSRLLHNQAVARRWHGSPWRHRFDAKSPLRWGVDSQLQEGLHNAQNTAWSTFMKRLNVVRNLKVLDKSRSLCASWRRWQSYSSHLAVADVASYCPILPRSQWQQPFRGQTANMGVDQSSQGSSCQPGRGYMDWGTRGWSVRIHTCSVGEIQGRRPHGTLLPRGETLSVIDGQLRAEQKFVCDN